MTTPVPATVISDVERYVEDALENARKYDNSTPLDDSGVVGLHALAQRIYAAGWKDGCAAQREMDRGRYQRRRDAEMAAQEPQH